MKFGYWTPVFGSWLRNVDDDSTQGTWEYCRDLALKAESLGYTLTLVPELYLNDIKGYTDVIHKFTSQFEKESDRLHVLEEIRDYFTRHKGEISKDYSDAEINLKKAFASSPIFCFFSNTFL